MGLASDPYTAYCFDEAVYMFGLGVENYMEDATKSVKKEEQKAAMRLAALNTILDGGEDDPDKALSVVKPASRFRDPAELMSRK